MFIKLTRLNGSPLWLNPEFIMRIEPWKAGALVVPAGDDLDYEVRETPAQLLAQLGVMPPASVAAAPAPVSVPPPRVPAPTSRPVAEPAPVPAPPSVVEPVPVEAVSAEPAPETPKKRTRKTSSTKKSTKKAASESVAEVPAEPAPAPAEPSVSISVTPAAPAPADEDIVAATAARLKKHGCKSEKKILNSLKSMFRRKSDEEIVALLQQMEDRGLVTLDDNGHATFA